MNNLKKDIEKNMLKPNVTKGNLLKITFMLYTMLNVAYLAQKI